jgi:hypothetical protein
MTAGGLIAGRADAQVIERTVRWIGGTCDQQIESNRQLAHDIQERATLLRATINQPQAFPGPDNRRELLTLYEEIISDARVTPVACDGSASARIPAKSKASGPPGNAVNDGLATLFRETPGPIDAAACRRLLEYRDHDLAKENAIAFAKLDATAAAADMLDAEATRLLDLYDRTSDWAGLRDAVIRVSSFAGQRIVTVLKWTGGGTIVRLVGREAMGIITEAPTKSELALKLLEYVEDHADFRDPYVEFNARLAVLREEDGLQKAAEDLLMSITGLDAITDDQVAREAARKTIETQRTQMRTAVRDYRTAVKAARTDANTTAAIVQRIDMVLRSPACRSSTD